MTTIERLRLHWPEYLIEAWALGTFMLAAATVTTLFEYPGSPVHLALADADLRRAMIGVAMGVTAIVLIHSPWGKRSGAHMNPAVTLAFLKLGRIARADAALFILAQFVGGALGVLIAWGLLGAWLAEPPVAFAMTVPGSAGVGVAFAAEFAISFAMMATVLIVSNHACSARYTGIAAGCLVAVWISIEAPLSGMSMNPARTFASAAPRLAWDHVWLYFVAPPLGMLAAAWLHARLRGAAHCAKLLHPADVKCIHCGYVPRASAVASANGGLGHVH